MHQVIEYYHETLLQSPEALEYLEAPRHRIRGGIETFKLGFANRTLGIGCRRRIASRGRRSAAGCSGWGCCANPGTSILTARW